MILLNNWEGQTAKDVFTEFDGTRWSAYREDDAIPVEEKPEFKDAEILLASYGTPSYEGYAFVLFRREGKLYEVNGSHCSCYGLEGQWDPEETTVEALRHRVNEGTLGKGDYDENPFAQELLAVLDGIAGVKTSGGSDAAWLKRIRETAAHLRDNSLKLAKYPGMGEEARARELAALYIDEIASLHEAQAAIAAGVGVRQETPDA